MKVGKLIRFLWRSWSMFLELWLISPPSVTMTVRQNWRHLTSRPGWRLMDHFHPSAWCFSGQDGANITTQIQSNSLELTKMMKTSSVFQVRRILIVSTTNTNLSNKDGIGLMGLILIYWRFLLNPTLEAEIVQWSSLAMAMAMTKFCSNIIMGKTQNRSTKLNFQGEIPHVLIRFWKIWHWLVASKYRFCGNWSGHA